jgi:tape measure domain-containing protein
VPVQITEELRVLVEAEVEKAIKSLEKFDQSVDASGKTTANLGDALAKMEKQALLMSAAVTGAGLAGVKFAADNEKLRASLEVLLGSAEKAESVFEEWIRFGATTPLSVEEIGTAGKQLLAFGIDAEEVTATMHRLGDVAQGVGSGLGDIADLYGKARVQGRLFTNDINQFQGRGIPIVQALAKELGVAEGEIKEMVAAGKIGFPELERAFVALTSNGGQFEGMMEKLSQTTIGKFSTAMDNAQQALASFGELMLPMVNEVLDFATGTFDALNNMDEGTKRFVLGMGGVIAISGPTIAAIKAISAAMTAAAANPYMLAIGGTIAALGLVAGGINALAHAHDDLINKIQKHNDEAKSLLTVYAAGNEEKVLDQETTDKLIKLYPELTGQIEAYKTTVKEAALAQEQLNNQKLLDAQEGRIKRIRQFQDDLWDLNQQIAEAEQAQAYWATQEQRPVGAETILPDLEAQKERLLTNIRQIRDQVNAELEQFGKRINFSGELLTLEAVVDTGDGKLDPPPVTPAQKKKWQEWYSEITKVDVAAIGQSGTLAAELYLEGFTRTLQSGQGVAEALGESFDLAGALRSEQDEIRKALQDLFAIDPKDIDDPFAWMDKSIAPLVRRFKELGGQIEDLDRADALEAFRKKIEDLGKTEWDLARETAAAASALKSEQDQLLKDYIVATFDKEIRDLTADEYDLARATYEAAGATEEELETLDEKIAKIKELKNQQSELDDWQAVLTEKITELLQGITGLDEKSAGAFANIAANLAAISFDGILQGIEDVGEAFAQGASAGEAFRNAMVSMLQQMLDMLPVLFLQAGLQMIIQGNWPMGLAFIAMAASSAFISGFVKGTINRMDEEAEAEANTNARGNVYSDTILVPYAKGGSFTNQLVNGPTYFRHGGGLGVMGEAGPEAIVPLRRMANGDLGIQSEGGGGTQVVVNIYNNSGAEVTTEERNDRNGIRQIDIMIGDLVGSQISQGRYDNAIESRFEGLHRRGH